jgi:hexokinase
MTKQSNELIQAPDYQQIKQNFLEELKRASQGKASSLSFIKHHLPTKPLVTHGIVQGIVIGGTNYILSTEEIMPDGTKKILERKTGVLPIFDTKETFISFLSEHLDQRALGIGVNFGFKLKTTYGDDGTLDGTILAKGTKEHTFTGLTEPVGTLVKNTFEKKYHKKIIVSVANDTVCLLLSGDSNEQGSLIAGTGFNIGILQKNTNQTYIINFEAGGFDKFIQSPILQKIDAKSKNPGKKLFEKTVSGKYLAQYFNEKIKELNIAKAPLVTSQELSELSHENHHNIAGDLARAIITRSAYLVAAALAGVYEFSGKPHTFAVIGEGSLLWDGWHYNENLKKQLAELGAKSVVLKHVKDSSINGAIGLLTTSKYTHFK